MTTMRRRALLALIALAGCGGSTTAGGAFVYAGGGSTIDVFRADADRATGALTLVGQVPAGDQAYLFEVDAGRRRAYLQTQLGVPVALRRFAIRSDGSLEPAGDDQLRHPLVEGVSQIQLHPTAPWLLASTTGGASGLQDQLMPVAPDGALGSARVISTDFYGFTWDPSGRFFFGLDGVAIGQFVFDPVAGSMVPNDPPQAEGSGGHPFLALKPHPGGGWVYSVEERAIGTFAFDAARGTLAARQYVGNPVPGDAISWGSMAVDPGGRFLYALGYLRDSKLAVIDQFAVDAGTGALTFVARTEGDERHALRLDSLQAPALLGDLLIVGGRSTAADLQGEPALVVYRLGATDGRLAAVGDPVPLQPAATTVVNFVAAALLER
jgi:hypothetical protein